MTNEIPKSLIEAAKNPVDCQVCGQGVLTYVFEPRKKELLNGTLRFPQCVKCGKFFIPEELPKETILKVLVFQFNETYCSTEQESFHGTMLRLEIIERENDQVEIVRREARNQVLTGKLSAEKAIVWIDGYWAGFRINGKIRRRKNNF